ncbi:hypothetical protein EBU95_17680 [bacterium]|nr:hypothetical protein [bacterium]
MINIIGKQALKLCIAEENTNKVEDKWCENHQKDILDTLERVEDLVEKAINSHSSSLSYQIFQQSKTNFVEYFLNISANYRRIQETHASQKPFSIV